MSRKMVKLFTCLMAALCFGIFAADGALPTDNQESLYTVRSGDNLWDVMSRRVSDEHDLRKYVYLTEQKNGIKNAYLEAGEKIILVLPKE